MPMISAVPNSPQSLIVLSRLLFPPRNSDGSSPIEAKVISEVASLSREEFDHLLQLANSNHVVVRALDKAFKIFRDAQDATRMDWAATALAAERARIHAAIPVLHTICAAFREEGHDLTVIKSLDHWPDLGSDLDLYSNADPRKVAEIMKRRFDARMETRSWGDRLAGKWNFLVPGLKEAVEIHVGRLGQTGEQLTLAARIPARSRLFRIEDATFQVPAASDRLMISTLQRMYRHFYFRLCDIVDTASLADAGEIDYEDLRSSAEASGIWEGVTTYMGIVSDYVRRYCGAGLNLPRFVRDAARFGGDQIYFARDFLRVPIMPQSARLYGTQLTGLLRKRQLHSSARLGLLPWLATAAAVGQKITGSDKGIW